MNWTPTATRADVIRMVRRYVQLEYSLRSAAGRLVIDETRMPRRRRGGEEEEFDLMGSSWVEIIEASRNYQIRQAVNAPLEPRRDVQAADGKPMRRVAPLREVAHVVRGGTKHHQPAGDGDARAWHATVAQKLGKIDRKEAAALLWAERLRISLQETRNKLMSARSDVGRLKSGGRNARNLRRHAEERVAELRSHEDLDSDRLRRLVKTRAYLRGVDRLLAACTTSAEVEAYCFGFDRRLLHRLGHSPAAR